MTSLGNHSCRAAVEANRLWWNGEWLRTFAGDFSTSPLVLWNVPEIILLRVMTSQAEFPGF
jgi:hypothetical protein